LEFAGLAAAYGAQTKNQQSCAIFSYLRSRALYKLGRYFEAFDACRESTTFWRKLSAKAFYLLQLPLEALCLTRLGRTDEARAVLEEVLPEIGPILAPNDGPEFMCMVALAQLERAQGNSSPARNALARAKEIASRRGFSQSGGTLVVNTVWPDFEELCVALADAPAREKAAADLSIVSAPLPGTHARKGSFDSHRLRSPRPKVEKAGPVKIQCKRCSRVMIGPMRRFENKRACSHCGARPFEFLVL
jgi:tetratricopeptide (TPR) repeat protein